MARPHKTLEALTSIADHLNPAKPLRLVGRLVRRASKRPGTPPGTIEYTGARTMEKVKVQVQAFRYDAEKLAEESWDQIPSDLRIPPPGSGVLWINVDGVHDVGMLERVGAALDLHPLVLEDVAHVGQRPKLEEYENYLFIVVHMLKVGGEPTRVSEEQVSLVLAPGLLCSFQEMPGDVFDPVRERLRQGKQRIRSGGSDYLAYALIDALVDSHFHILEELGNETEDLELEVLESPSQETIEAVHHLKREFLVIRRTIWPLREVMSSLLRSEGGFVAEPTKVFLRDVHDHTYQLIDTVEILRDVASGMRDLYLSNVSNRTNEVMKVLTIMASVFIPLTFVAGVYGMNFENMPELGWAWGYPAVLLLMVAMILIMVWYFKRKDWI